MRGYPQIGSPHLYFLKGNPRPLYLPTVYLVHLVALYLIWCRHRGRGFPYGEEKKKEKEGREKKKKKW